MTTKHPQTPMAMAWLWNTAPIRWSAAVVLGVVWVWQQIQCSCNSSWVPGPGRRIQVPFPRTPGSRSAMSWTQRVSWIQLALPSWWLHRGHRSDGSIIGRPHSQHHQPVHYYWCRSSGTRTPQSPVGDSSMPRPVSTLPFHDRFKAADGGGIPPSWSSSSLTLSLSSLPATVAEDVGNVASGRFPRLPTVLFVSDVFYGCQVWFHLQRRLSLAGVASFSYDRPGTGFSSVRCVVPSRTAEASAEELRYILEFIGVRPPFLLVGHGTGGLIARIFSTKWPQWVAAAILVDSVLEEDPADFPLAIPYTTASLSSLLFRLMGWICWTGWPWAVHVTLHPLMAGWRHLQRGTPTTIAANRLVIQEQAWLKRDRVGLLQSLLIHSTWFTAADELECLQQSCLQVTLSLPFFLWPSATRRPVVTSMVTSTAPGSPPTSASRHSEASDDFLVGFGDRRPPVHCVVSANRYTASEDASQDQWVLAQRSMYRLWNGILDGPALTKGNPQCPLRTAGPSPGRSFSMGQFYVDAECPVGMMPWSEKVWQGLVQALVDFQCSPSASTVH